VAPRREQTHEGQATQAQQAKPDGHVGELAELIRHGTRQPGRGSLDQGARRQDQRQAGHGGSHRPCPLREAASAWPARSWRVSCGAVVAIACSASLAITWNWIVRLGRSLSPLPFLGGQQDLPLRLGQLDDVPHPVGVQLLQPLLEQDPVRGAVPHLAATLRAQEVGDELRHVQQRQVVLAARPGELLQQV
jgi:hypothetical protein